MQPEPDTWFAGVHLWDGLVFGSIYQGAIWFLFGCGSQLNHQGTAGFSPCFHLPGFHLSHNQNPVLKWSTQNHVKNSEGYFWLGLPLTNLHLAGF